MKIPQLNFIRFVLSSALVIFHFGLTIYPFDQPVLNALFRSANLGVSIFFVLSGFVLVITYHDEEKGTILNKEQYWVNRLARIYPVYLLSMVLCFISILLANPEAIRPLPVLLSMLLLQAWIPPFPLYMNGLAWALSVQVFFYVIFPFVLPVLARLSTSRLIKVVFAFWAISLFVHVLLIETIYGGGLSYAHDVIFYNPLMHVNSFIVGIGGGLMLQRMPAGGNSYVPGLCMLLSGACLAAFVLVPNPVIRFGHNGLLAPLGMLFIFGLARDRSALSSVLTTKPVMLLGDLSYGIFILQGPLKIFVKYQYITQGVTWSSPTRFYVYLFLLALLSLTSYYLIEKPARNLIKRVFAASVSLGR
jgi:peptidoglycan/LPS O-acetylase OafA/YrhL